VRVALHAVLAAALLVPGCAWSAGSESALVGLINDYRAAPRECEGRREPMASPLAPSATLADVDPGSSRDLGRALAANGYRAAAATTILYAGRGDAAAVLRFVEERYCRSLLDPRYSQIGVARTRDAWRINLARPLLPPDIGDWRQAGKTVLRLVNEARARPRRCGADAFAAAPPLTWNDTLAEAARAHSLDMAEKNYFSHDDHAGDSVAQRATRAGYRWRHVGENIAAGVGDPGQVVAGWLASPGHCANIMAPDFADMGAAYAADPRSTLDIYWTQTFGKR
jgi:uncharacterized protein YkwD